MFDVLDHCKVSALHVHEDAASGLKAMIAIHNTQLGPALGGCRFISYPSLRSALDDVAYLARGMTYKAALANVPQGGGKAVIIEPDRGFDRARIFKEFGRFVDSLKGQYITAIDSGTDASDMDLVATETTFVTSTSHAGSPSPHTARGVFEGIRTAVQYRLGGANLCGLRVVLQGVGSVGFVLGKLLDRAGAEVWVSDINQHAIDRALATFACGEIKPEVAASTPCDVFVPCGLSKAITQTGLPALRCAVIAGSANVQLAHVALGDSLHQRGILYAPDFVINAGGLIYASLQYHGARLSQIHNKVLDIGSTLATIFEQSRSDDLAPSYVALRLAEQRLRLAVNQAA